MKLSIKGLAIASGLLWGIAILIVGAAHMIWPSYGTSFLELMSSLYPGYDVDTGVTGLIVGTLYGVVDGGIGGALFAWVYNFFAE